MCDKGFNIQGAIYPDISDNFPIVHIDYKFQVPQIDSVCTKKYIPLKKKTEKRQQNKQNKKKTFRSTVSEIDWEALYILDMQKNPLPGFIQHYTT